MVKIDNLVQIGHNCKVGAHSLICGCVGLAGSTEIGRHCVLAGGCGVGGKNPVKICDQVILSAKTAVTQSIDKPGAYSGSIPGLAMEHGAWIRNAVKFGALSDLFKRVKKLENGSNMSNGKTTQKFWSIYLIVPFLLIDRVTDLVSGRHQGYKNVTVNEELFNGHFPGQPILPGVLILEAMAQLSGALAFETGRAVYRRHQPFVRWCREGPLSTTGDSRGSPGDHQQAVGEPKNDDEV